MYYCMIDLAVKSVTRAKVIIDYTDKGRRNFLVIRSCISIYILSFYLFSFFPPPLFFWSLPFT